MAIQPPSLTGTLVSRFLIASPHSFFIRIPSVVIFHTVHAAPPPGRVSGQTDRQSNFGTDRHTHHTVHANPPVEFRDRQRETVYMGEELGNYVHQNMGEELGNYVHQNMGEELGNYVHQNNIQLIWGRS